MADYLNVYELFEERLLPFIRHMVEFLGIGHLEDGPLEADQSAGTSTSGAVNQASGTTTTTTTSSNRSSELHGLASSSSSSSPQNNQSVNSAASYVFKKIDDKLLEFSPRAKVSSTSSEPTAMTSMLDAASPLATNNSSGNSSNSCDDVFSVEPLLYCGENLGKIQVAVLYDSREMVLTLKIIQASELVAKDFSGTSDPYVKILLLPDKRNKLTTKVKRKNLNPKWNETFLFEGFPYTKLLNRTLYLQVLDYDRFSRDDPIGEVSLPLCELQLSTTGQIMWKTLEPCKGHQGILGELLVSLNYKPSHGVITVGILQARNLKAKDINGQSDPYVKIWLMFDGKRIEKRKTGIKEKCLNPTFEEEFPFLVPYEKIRQTSLFISVMDYDRMGRNELIGQVLLGSKSGPMEIKHWNEMFSKSKTDVKKWHMLKSFS